MITNLSKKQQQSRIKLIYSFFAYLLKYHFTLQSQYSHPITVFLTNNQSPAKYIFDQFYILIFFYILMKYNLRSASSEPETNELSSPLPDKKHSKTNRQMKGNCKVKKIIKKTNRAKKSSPKTAKFITKKQTKIRQTIQQGPFHHSILRFPLKYIKKTLRVYCYKESDLDIKKRFRKCYGKHQKDDDLESWESLIEEEVERCKKDLFESVRKYSEAKSQSKSEDKNEMEASTDESNKSSMKIEVNKAKKINKKQKNKRNK